MPSTNLDAARERLRGDWDEDGTSSVYLPVDAAQALLRARGWTTEQRELKRSGFAYTVYIAPDGEQYDSAGDALQVALVAEVTG